MIPNALVVVASFPQNNFSRQPARGFMAESLARIVVFQTISLPHMEIVLKDRAMCDIDTRCLSNLELQI